MAAPRASLLTDLFASVIELAGAELPRGRRLDSLEPAPLPAGPGRPAAQLPGGGEAFYDLREDPAERRNLLTGAGLSPGQLQARGRLYRELELLLVSR